MKRSNQRASVLFYCGIVVLCLFFASSYVSNGLYARYMSSASSFDSARVARFDVSIEAGGQDFSMLESISLASIQPGGKGKVIAVAVTNKSEVAVGVSVNLKNVTGNLPLTIQLTDILGNPISKDVIVLQPAGLGTSEEVVYFTVFWDKNLWNPHLSGMTDLLELAVTAAQVD